MVFFYTTIGSATKDFTGSLGYLAHKNACPNKDGLDVYEGRAPWDEKIEEKNKKEESHSHEHSQGSFENC